MSSSFGDEYEIFCFVWGIKENECEYLPHNASEGLKMLNLYTYDQHKVLWYL